MSMVFSTPLEKLRRCPSCRSRRLVVEVYRDQRRPVYEGRYESYLECEGCYSVVCELPGAMEDQVHPKVRARRSIL
jgi:hypothetical protein